jgi:hypothetical protein
MRCINPACGRKFDKSDRTDHRPQIYCSHACYQEDKKRYIWQVTDTNRRKAVNKSFTYRDIDAEPLSAVELAYARYVKECLPNPPTYDLDEWWELTETYGDIDW